jgi:hypothetical protein
VGHLSSFFSSVFSLIPHFSLLHFPPPLSSLTYQKHLKLAFDMAPTGYTRLSVTEQPQPELSMNFSTEKFVEKAVAHQHEANETHEHDCQQCDESAGHRRCHNGRLRRFLLPIIAAFLLLGSLMAVACMLGHGSEWGLEGLVARAVDNTANGNNSPFVRNKRESNNGVIACSGLL